MLATPDGYRLVIAGTGRLLHLAKDTSTVSVCGRHGMCTAGGFAVSEQHPMCRRCETRYGATVSLPTVDPLQSPALDNRGA
jgi:hypothetical protein